MKTLLGLHKQYLSSSRTLLDGTGPAFGKLATTLELAEPGLKSHKLECVGVFELFCELMKHIMGACGDKRLFFSLFGVVSEFVKQLNRALKEAFDTEIIDTHYLKQFDKHFYAYERNSYVLRSIRYPFLYTPVSGNIDVNASSRLYIVLISLIFPAYSKLMTRSGKRSSMRCCTSSQWHHRRIG
jgi:hypothetical protein